MTGFSNIEAVNVIGSQYDDVLVGFAVESYWSDSSVFPVSPMVDGGMGFDELVLDYSQSNQDLGIQINADYAAAPPMTSLDVLDNSGFIKSLDFNNIEAFEITTGRGDDDIELGYDNYSDDRVNAGAGNDYISTGHGFDIVDGGTGFDVLNLDFTNSESGVNSYLNSIDSGVYISSDTTVEFSNIEAVEILGSFHDDLLVAFAGQNNLEIDSDVDGGDGIDRLVVNYGDNDQDYDLQLTPVAIL